FFSSRRRHTRSYGDWSSDVCSSDLKPGIDFKPVRTYMALVQDTPEKDEFEVDARLAPHPIKTGLMRIDAKHGKRARTLFEVRERSEERRVGKERRAERAQENEEQRD